MKRFRTVLWGIVLVALGVIIGIDATGFADIDVFFDGWWTLLIIIPCFIGLFTEGQKDFNIIGICLGCFLFLCCRDILEFSMLWKLGVPIMIVVIGIKMILGGVFKNKSDKVIQKNKVNGVNIAKHSALFSGSDANYSGEIFYGTELSAIFGGVACDLRSAFVEQDCVIKATAIFGGVDIYVPEGVNVKVHSTSIFGGVSNEEHKNSSENPHTIFVNAVCLFGGVDIK